MNKEKRENLKKDLKKWKEISEDEALPFQFRKALSDTVAIASKKLKKIEKEENISREIKQPAGCGCLIFILLGVSFLLSLVFMVIPE